MFLQSTRKNKASWCRWIGSRASVLCGLAIAFSVSLNAEHAKETRSNSSIPKIIGDDGKYISEAVNFSTKKYERAALKLLIAEANSIARQLRLPEDYPISEEKVNPFVVGYGMSQVQPRIIGNVQTVNYGYYASVDHKLSYVIALNQERMCFDWMQKYKWPTNRVDKIGAYRIATQWLASASMDVNRLNKECSLKVEPNTYWNSSNRRKGIFVPIYDVFWMSSKNATEGYGSAAAVTLFMDKKTNMLISLCVEESKYILRQPLTFTNLAELLSVPK